MHECSELAVDILKTLIANSGSRGWDDEQTREKFVNAAIDMAVDLYVAEGSEPMSNETYIEHGTAVVFGSEVGDDVAWSTENISDGAGRQASLYDQGAEGTARPERWQYRFYTQAQATPTVGNMLECHLKTSDGSHPDNDDGASDAAVSAADKLKNLTLLLSPIVDEAAANVEFVSKGTIRIPHRYFGPVLWNAMGSAVTNDAGETKAVFTPIYEQQQS